MTTRRMFLAAGSASAVFGALKATANSETGAALALTIERHRAAHAAVEAHPEEEDVPRHLTLAEMAAFRDLTFFRCADEKQLLIKLRYMVGHLKYTYRAGWREESLELIDAIDLHLTGKAA